MTDIQRRVVQDLISKYEGEQLQEALQKVLGENYQEDEEAMALLTQVERTKE